MWQKLDVTQKEKYKSLITNFSSLSEVFSQKSESETTTHMSELVAPIVNSKYQETAFQRAFEAVGEDIANTSYDASLTINEKYKYLIGIKSFGFHSADQKIAQFKASSVSDGWSITLADAIKNVNELKDKKITDKQIADEQNELIYREVALKIAKLRNERIASSKEQIKGFDASGDLTVEAIYHVLMPSRKGEDPQIHVGETSYLPIDVENIRILGSTGLGNPANFRFTDGQHTYKYTDADSQLLMTFNNKEIVVETWDVSYMEDAFSFFEELHLTAIESKTSKIEKSYSWMIANESGEVEESSGYNGFDGATKLAKANNYREERIRLFKNKYEKQLSDSEMTSIVYMLEQILLVDYSAKEDKRKMKQNVMC